MNPRSILIGLLLIPTTPAFPKPVIMLEPSLFEYSAISLMPEGEPESVEAFTPLHPTVMAWGIDPVFSLDDLEALKARFEAYRRLGVDQRAVNVWMLTATPYVLHTQPEYQDAVCLDIAGNRIVPTWLADGFYEGTPSYWGCTNHPLFRDQVILRARSGIAAGGNLLHLDDHMGTAAAAYHAGGCFCDFCMDGFQDWLIEQEMETDLIAMGLPDIENFNYRDHVRSLGFTTLDAYRSGLKENAVPLREEFLSFQRQAAAAFVGELGDLATAEAGRPIPVGVNAWNLAPSQMATAHQADYFSNEIQHYSEEDLIPPAAYLLATALGKPVFATGTGEDWIRINASNDIVRVRRWIATAAAFGQYFMYSYRKWGFSEETGTQWYQTPIETYLPLTDFITENRDLFDGFEAVSQIGVLYNNEACRDGQWSVREVVRDLHDAGYSCALAVAGDAWLQQSLSLQSVEECETLVIPPGSIPSGEQGSLISDALASGDARNWEGIISFETELERWIKREGSGRLWTLPRKKTDPVGSSLVIHLLNQDYDPETDSMIPAGESILSISRHLTGDQPMGKVILHTPGMDARPLDLTTSGDAYTVRIPSIDLWSILELAPNPTTVP